MNLDEIVLIILFGRLSPNALIVGNSSSCISCSDITNMIVMVVVSSFIHHISAFTFSNYFYDSRIHLF